MKHPKSLATAIIVFLTAWTAHAGGLTPPSAALSNGTPVAVMKTLNQIEPRTLIPALPYYINTPGSYYLAQPLTCTSAVNGINIGVGEVRIDLNGFSITGTSNALDGVQVTAPCQNITIRNGIVRKWGHYGIMATNAAHVTAVNLTIYDNGWGGMYAGTNSLVKECSVYGNGATAPPTNMPPADDGIMVGPYSTIKDCKVYANYGAGIHTFSHSRITGCTATESVNADGIHCEDYCTVRECTAARNRAGGIKAGSMCRITANTCGENGYGTTNHAPGILIIGASSYIADNNTCKNYYGIRTEWSGSAGNLVVRNVCSNNTNDYYFGAGQHSGPVVDPVPGGFSGADPWANFIAD